MIAIPFDPSKSADQTLNFNGLGIDCTLRFTWNVFSDCWFVSFGDIQPRRLVINFPILKSMRYRLPFPGDFMMKRTAEVVGDEIGFEDLGSNWLLCYLTAAEVEAWGVRNGLD